MRETYGHIYVYFIYGMYYCLNFTTERAGVGAVLIRAAEPTAGIELMARRRGTDDLRRLARGPGRLCQAFGIGPEMNGLPVGRELKLRPRRGPIQVSTSRRVGITRAAGLEWRFYETGSPFVSAAPY
jgi:DNA-3-methyladenine glycosylase